MYTEKIWYQENPFSAHNVFEFVPRQDMTYEQQLNSLMRLSVYFAILVALVRRSVQILYFPLAMMAFTFWMYFMHDRERFTKAQALKQTNLAYDARRRRVCAKPTRNNPYMNVLATDYSQAPKRPPACDVLDCEVKKSMRREFNRDLIRDAGDVFEKQASDRQYYTTPVTTIPNDQTSFAKWLYALPKTCKDDSIQCWRGRRMGV
jgi:hypothetical protein